MLAKISFLYMFLMLLLAAGSLSQVTFADLYRRLDDEAALASSIMGQIRIKGQTDTPTSAAALSTSDTSRNAHTQTTPGTVLSTKAEDNANSDNSLTIEPIPMTDPVVASIMSRITVIGNNGNSGTTRNVHRGSTTMYSVQATASKTSTTSSNTLPSASLDVDSILDLIAVPKATSSSDKSNAKPNNNQSVNRKNGFSHVEPVPTTNSDVYSIMNRITVSGSSSEMSTSCFTHLFEISSASDRSISSKTVIKGNQKGAKLLPTSDSVSTKYVLPIPTTDPDVTSFVDKITVSGQSSNHVNAKGATDVSCSRSSNTTKHAATKALTSSREFDSLTSLTDISDIINLIDVDTDGESSQAPTSSSLLYSTSSSTTEERWIPTPSFT